MVELAEDIIATDDGLGIFLPEISSLVIADLHLGLELSLLREGTYLPIDQYQLMYDKIKKLLKQFKPQLMIINGDFKHEFARASPQEWYELKALLRSLSKHGVDLEIVRGNHDNYLKTVLSHMGMSIREPYFIRERYLFMHGHQSLQDVFGGELPEVTWLILGHEHPAIELRDDTGGKHKFKCYLHGTWNKYKILVLPAYSPLASGTVVNKVTGSDVLSPVLRELPLAEFKPLVVDNGELISFPVLRDLKKLSDDYFYRV